MVYREPYGWIRYMNSAMDLVCDSWRDRRWNGRWNDGGRNWKKSQKKIRRRARPQVWPSFRDGNRRI